MSKHTPAPWNNGANIPLTAKSCERNGFNLIFVNRVDSTEPDANAKLIAAAPELLDALEPDRSGADFLDWIADRLIHVHGEDPDQDFIICLRRRARKARAAIAKVNLGTSKIL